MSQIKLTKFQILLALFVLAAIFALYLKPDFVVDLSNQLLTLCGW
jgi:hypothetical protein